MKRLMYFAILVIGLFLISTQLVQATNPNNCPNSGNGWTKIDSNNLSAYPVEGATEYCFKAGSEQSNGCNGGKFTSWPQPEGTCGLSHWSYFIPTPTPTPTQPAPVCPLQPSESGILFNGAGAQFRLGSWDGGSEFQVERNLGSGTSITAGTYQVRLASADNRSHPHQETQPHEEYFLEFRDASGSVLAKSGAISDLPDSEVLKQEVVNSSLSIPSGVASVFAVHNFQTTDTKFTANSIEPICALLEPVQVSPSPTPTPVAQKLGLTFMCKDGDQYRWRVNNSNNYSIDYTWDLYGKGINGQGSVQAGQTLFTTSTGGTMRIFVNNVLQNTKASNENPCATPTPAPSPFIRVTTMGWCAPEEMNYLRLRNDGQVAVENAAYYHVQSKSVTGVGPLTPGQQVIFSGPDGQYDAGYIQNEKFVKTHGRSSTNQNPYCASTPTPTPSATPSPTPSETPGVGGSGRESKIELTGITCDNNNFDAKYYAFENGQPVKGVNVGFEYRNEKKDAVTNDQGLAQVGFTFRGVDTVFMRPDGFPEVNARIDDATGCENPTTPTNSNGTNGTNGDDSNGVGGQVLGVITDQAASTTAEGDVLGTNSLAATGLMEDVIGRMTGILGGAFVMIGSYLYAKKKISA